MMSNQAVEVAHRLLVPHLGQAKTGDVQESDNNSHLKYQPVVLDKVYAGGVSSAQDSESLRLIRVNGIYPLEPDRQLNETFLSHMIQQDPDYRCEYLICVAMYNEGPSEFIPTMEGICKNLKTFVANGIDPRKIACIIIVDGMRPCMDAVKNYPGLFSHVFDEQAIKQRFNVQSANDVKIQEPGMEIAHLFTQNLQMQDNQPPLQLVFCVKQLNKRKLNTHLWFFGGFCEAIKPRFVQLLDIGTKPLSKALWLLYEAMATDKKCAGVCGEIAPLEPSFWSAVESAQMVEYKFSHIFDKPLESCFGFITVLPGAFSAYRWSALQGAPLYKNYFKSQMKPELMDAYHSNIFLAEDRVLSLALVSKRGCDYYLKFVATSVALTDVPDTLFKLLAQRRRWINGSWFALIDSLREFKKVNKSSHSCFTKFCIYLEMIYFGVNVLFAFLMVGLFFLTFSVLLRNTFPDDTEDKDLFDIGNAFIILYFTILLVVFILSLSTKPIHVNGFYHLISVILGLYMFAIIALMINFFINLDTDDQINLAAGAFPVVGFLIGMILYNSVFIILKGVIQFLFMTPTYVNLFLIYSMCNIHDCTWGNRPDQLTGEEKRRLEEFEVYRAKWVIIWVCLNSIFVYFLNKFEKNQNAGINLIAFIAFFGTLIFLVRFLGMIIFWIRSKCNYVQYDPNLNSKRTDDENPNNNTHHNLIVPNTQDDQVHDVVELDLDQSSEADNKKIVVAVQNDQIAIENLKELLENNQVTYKDVRRNTGMSTSRIHKIVVQGKKPKEQEYEAIEKFVAQNQENEDQ